MTRSNSTARSSGQSMICQRPFRLREAHCVEDSLCSRMNLPWPRSISSGKAWRGTQSPRQVRREEQNEIERVDYARDAVRNDLRV